MSPAARLVVFDIIAVHGLAARTFDGLRQAEVPPITVAVISRVPIAASSNFWHQKKPRPHFASRPLLNRGNWRNIAVSSFETGTESCGSRHQVHRNLSELLCLRETRQETAPCPQLDGEGIAVPMNCVFDFHLGVVRRAVVNLN